MGSKRVLRIDEVKGLIVPENFIKRTGATGLINGWAAYADTVQATPVTGTGGAPASTFASSTDSSLVGASNFLWTKTAVNRQGEGFSYAFTIDSGYQSRPMTISALYKVASGTYADNDMSVWVYDVTNAVMIQPSAYQILNTTGVAQIKCEFQAASNSTSYRLIFHTASVSALAYTIRFDSFSVSPNTYNAGAGITTWSAFTPVWTAVTTNPTFGTVTVNSAFQRRVGDSLEINYTLQAAGTGGTAGSGAYLFALPTGLSMDTTKIGAVGASTTTQDATAIGHGSTVYSGNTKFLIEAFAFDATHVSFTYGNNQTNTASIVNNANLGLNSMQSFSFNVKVPILGWGTSQVLSSDTDTRVIYASYYASAVHTPGANGQINFDTKLMDTHGAVTTGAGAWKFVATTAGLYLIDCVNGYSSGTATYLQLWKNGVAYQYLETFGVSGDGLKPLSASIYLNGGDYIDIRTVGSVAVVGSSTPYQTKIGITRMSGPAQIAASEKVYLQYTGNAGTVLTADVTNIDFTSKVVDSHGAWNGTTFTAPRPGFYNVTGTILLTASVSVNPYIWINAVKKYFMANPLATNAHGFSGGTYLNAGDAMTFRSDTGATLLNSATVHWISITSQG